MWWWRQLTVAEAAFRQKSRRCGFVVENLLRVAKNFSHHAQPALDKNEEPRRLTLANEPFPRCQAYIGGRHRAAVALGLSQTKHGIILPLLAARRSDRIDLQYRLAVAAGGGACVRWEPEAVENRAQRKQRHEENSQVKVA